MRSRCEAYTAYVYLDKTPYRNAHCAICNNIGLHFLQCQKAPTRSFHNKEFSPIAFAVLFDLNDDESSSVGKVRCDALKSCVRISAAASLYFLLLLLFAWC